MQGFINPIAPLRALLALLLALGAASAAAQPTGRADLYLFWSDSCPHCRDEVAFLKHLEAEEPRLRVHYLEVSRDRRNQDAFTAVVERIKLEEPAVPLTVVGSFVMVGYGGDATSGAELRRRVFESLPSLASDKRFWLALAGSLALAFAVNLVELLCSAGIPAVYTQVLALSEIPAWQYYAYLALYILAFMLDDLFVFVVAMKTLQVTGVTTRYVRFAHLAGGIVLLAIGALLLLRPELLMFG